MKPILPIVIKNHENYKTLYLNHEQECGLRNVFCLAGSATDPEEKVQEFCKVQLPQAVQSTLQLFPLRFKPS